MVGCRQRPPTRHRPRPRPGRICLDLCDEREVPLLLGTATLREQPTIQASCCRPAREACPVARTSPAQANAILYSQLLPPFTDVICFYAYDLEDLKMISRQILA
ncbi:hypothetical protein F5Y08DRAFT_324850 [Xylaria arbuscula]|nr:hypothetical protein F5Y08DRAFT_324850 [Xylaria arbuscula]